MGVSSKPIVLLSKAIQAYGYCLQPSCDKLLTHLPVQQYSITHHPPVKTSLPYCFSTFEDVIPDKRFPACRYDKNPTRIHL